MRTAEEIILEKCPHAKRGDWMEVAIECINTARKEAIEECAERAKIINIPQRINQSNIGADALLQNQQSVFVDKQSILNLINEIQ